MTISGCVRSETLELSLRNTTKSALIGVWSEGSLSIVAVDPESPPLIDDDVASGFEVAILEWDQPFSQRHVRLVSGPVTQAESGEPATRLKSADHIRVRTVPDDEGWRDTNALPRWLDGFDLPLEPACFDAIAHELDIPPGDLVGGVDLDANRTLLVINASDGSQAWLVIQAGQSSPYPGTPPTSATAFSKSFEGSFALLGVGPDGTDEAFLHSATSTTFQRLPDLPGETADHWHWISVGADGGIWVMSRLGTVTRWKDGSFTPEAAADVQVDGRNHGALAAIDADRVDAVLPFLYMVPHIHTLVSWTGSTPVIRRPERPLAYAATRWHERDLTILGDEGGQLWKWPTGAEPIVIPSDQPGSAPLSVILPAESGGWSGLVYTGLNGPFYQYWEGYGFCEPSTRFAFNAIGMAPSGDDFVVWGTDASEERKAHAAYVERQPLH